jgi:molybdopterin synthase sulfur carrier subunit
VTVRLFAMFRDLVGASEVHMEVPPEGLTVRELWASLESAHPALAQRAPSPAINAAFVRGDALVRPGDEVAFLPPVSGG